MIGGISAQALALVIILSPGLMFLIGFSSAPLAWPTRKPLLGNFLADVSLFTVTSGLLHLTAGFVIIRLFDQYSSCNYSNTFAIALNWTSGRGDLSLCSFETEVLLSLIYIFCVSLLGLPAGRIAAGIIARSPELFRKLYGGYYKIPKGTSAFITATVVSDIENSGTYLAYEGELHELGLAADNSIKYVSLIGVKRFSLAIDGAKADTSRKEDYISMDRNLESIAITNSIVTFPGERVLNLLTRTSVIKLSGKATNPERREGSLRR